MTDIPLKVEVEKKDNVAVINLAANFYTSNTMAHKLKETFNTLIEGKIYNIIVNMSEVSSIDSEGLGVLSSGYKFCISKGGNFVICELNNRDVADVIEIVNLDKIIPIYKTKEEALTKINID